MNDTTRHSTHATGVTLDLRLDTAALERAVARATQVPEDLGPRIARALSGIRRVMEQMVQDSGHAFRQIAAAFQCIHQRAADAANTPAAVAGLSARYQVRAGLDPAYRTPDALDALVASIMAGAAEDTALLTREHRAEVAASALRGWVESYPAALPVLTWHRLVGGVHVVVTRG